MRLAILPRTLLIPVLGLAIGLFSGCGSSGGDSSATTPTTPTTPTNSGPVFSARSAELTGNSFGEAEGIRTYQSFQNGKNDAYRSVYNFQQKSAGGVATLTLKLSFIDADSKPITDNFLLNLLSAIAESLQLSYAIDTTGAIWVVATNDKPLGEKERYQVFPSTSAIKSGLTWSEPLDITTDTNGVITQQTGSVAYTVLSTSAISLKAKRPGCILLRETTVINASKVAPASTSSIWFYYQPGVGKVEDTNVDPAQDQSSASGSYLVPNAG